MPDWIQSGMFFGRHETTMMRAFRQMGKGLLTKGTALAVPKKSAR
jgi:hypothetical protein